MQARLQNRNASLKMCETTEANTPLRWVALSSGLFSRIIQPSNTEMSVTLSLVSCSSCSSIVNTDLVICSSKDMYGGGFSLATELNISIVSAH